jgi:hypothetical protein
MVKYMANSSGLLWLGFIFSGILFPCEVFTQSSHSTEFPLRLNNNSTYLEGKDGKPFLIKEISAWGLIQALSEQDESAFMDSVRKKGFNTLMVSIISYDQRFAGGPPRWQGISPFKTEWDFSTYNPAYFEHADRFLKMAASKGLLVLLVPCYLGYKNDSTQGWWNSLLSPKNDPAKSRFYGQFLGSRYKDFSNIIWLAGGDNRGEGKLATHTDAIFSGIREYDRQHLWTGHFDSAMPTNWSSGSLLYGKYMDIDGLYDFTESSLGEEGPQYKTELAHYGRGKMIFQLDQSYEHDIPHGADNEDPRWIRRKNYQGLLSGCTGTSFSPGARENQCYTLTNWRPLMNTEGMRQVSYCFRAFESRPWYMLVPDTARKIIKSGGGTFGKTDFACAARTSDSSTVMVYLPEGKKITLDLGQMAGGMASAWWFDPSSGKSRAAGTFSTGGDREFVPPSLNDWLLVLDNASLHLPPPR